MKLVYRSITYEIQKQFPYQLQISRIVFAFESTFQTWLCECVCGSGISNRKGAFYKQSIVDYKTNVCMRRFELIEMMLKY